MQASTSGGAGNLLDDELARALLLAMLDAPGPGGTSLPRLAKRLRTSVSVLLRRLTLMSAATLGGHAGPAWVRVEQSDNRWVAYLTDSGRAYAAALPVPQPMDE